MMLRFEGGGGSSLGGCLTSVLTVCILFEFVCVCVRESVGISVVY